jgi:Protein of unknown function (DUF4199)
MNPLTSKLSVRHGLLIGGISVVLTIVFYIINPVLQYTSIWLGLFSFAIMITLFVILGIDVRKKIGGFWSFGEAYLSLLIMSVVVVVISILVSFILFKFIDPTLPQKVTDALADVTSKRLESMGLDQSQIDAANKQFTDGEMLAKFQPTLLTEVKNLGIGIIIYAVVDLILAACIKKKRPMFAAVSDDEVVE